MYSKTITILEGPDGGGKSTLAKKLAEKNDAIIVHHGLYPRFNKHLARLYVESMLPALLGYQNIVMDRSWLSDNIYGAVYRRGQDRLGAASRRMLDRIAMRCGAQVIVCMPEFKVCASVFNDRLPNEYLDNIKQLQLVYELYRVKYQNGTLTGLPKSLYRFDRNDSLPIVDSLSLPTHSLVASTAGNLAAPIVLVGEKFADRKEHDPLYQAPFVSFSDAGCSRWFTNQLMEARIPERQLLWINTDHPKRVLSQIIHAYPRQLVCVLGNVAAEVLGRMKLKMPIAFFQHPQYIKRFQSKSRYSLIDRIKEIIS